MVLPIPRLRRTRGGDTMVKPKNCAILRGFTIEYSMKLFRSDSVLYFLMGRLPVIYTSAKTLMAFTSVIRI